MGRNSLLALVGLVVLVVAAMVSAAPSPNNCGLNMLCRVRTLIVSGDTSFAGVTAGGVVSAGGFDGGAYRGTAANLSSTLGVTGAATFGTIVSTPITDGGIGIFSGTLNVGGNTVLGADLDVTGTVTANIFRGDGTTLYHADSYVADGANTAFSFDAINDLTSSLHTRFRDNTNVTIATVDYAGSVQAGTVLANEVTLAGAATSSPVTITATGSDTDVSVNVVPKGAGALTVSGALVAIFSGASNTNQMLCGGETTLSGGTGSGDFTDASCADFGASPMCIVSGQTAFCSMTGISTSAVTLGGTGADKCNWLCFGTAP